MCPSLPPPPSVYLSGVPQLSGLAHDKARRFITLVDALYDAHTQLIWTAETDPKGNTNNPLPVPLPLPSWFSLFYYTRGRRQLEYTSNI